MKEVVVGGGLLGGRSRNAWTAICLVTTILTSVTGFGFPVDHVLPSHIVGVISLAVLAVAVVSRHGLHLRGTWRRAYVVSTVAALYLNVFVGVVQAFRHVPALRALAPHQSEPPLVVAQLFVLGLFVILGGLAARRFRGESVASA